MPAIIEQTAKRPTVRFNLLTDGDANTKLRKSNKSTKPYVTFGLSLAPHSRSGFDVCKHATDGCRQACVGQTGLAFVFPMIMNRRIEKTKRFFADKQGFLADLHKDLAKACRAGERFNANVAVRLNTFSDLPWERIDRTLFDYPIQYYDYTKWPDRDVPTNCHLTFSYSGHNWDVCKRWLDSGRNVAMVFDGDLPSMYAGYPVYNADETDLRFLDPWGLQGLSVKGRFGDNGDGFYVRSPMNVKQYTQDAFIDLAVLKGGVK